MTLFKPESVKQISSQPTLEIITTKFIPKPFTNITPESDIPVTLPTETTTKIIALSPLNPYRLYPSSSNHKEHLGNDYQGKNDVNEDKKMIVGEVANQSVFSTFSRTHRIALIYLAWNYLIDHRYWTSSTNSTRNSNRRDHHWTPAKKGPNWN